MTLSIVHLSDIHFKSEASSNPLLDRQSALQGAIRSAVSSADSILIIMSGDTAYSGTADEYAHALQFFTSCVTQLKDDFPKKQIGFGIVPGNHDCSFQETDDTRAILRKGFDPFEATDDGPIKNCLGPQKEYQLFIENLKSQLPKDVCVCALDQWHSIVDCNLIEDHKLVLNLLNTAWASEIREKPGVLSLPQRILEDRLSNDATADLVISVLHHPYNWLEPTNARSIRKLVEGCSDIVLTGHEHDSGVFTRSSHEATPTYVEGGVLQDSDNPQTSGFNVLTVDIEQGTYTATTYGFRKSPSEYAPTDETPPSPYVRNKARLAGSFPFDESFDQWLSDAGVVFTHPSKRKLSLDDIFVCPEFQEVSNDDSRESAAIISSSHLFDVIQKEKHVVFFGSETCGKTSLAKYICRHFRSDGQVPLIVSGEDLSKMRKHHERKALDPAISRVYGSQQKEAFWQLAPARRVVIVDDYQQLQGEEGDRDRVLSYLAEHFCCVILLATDDVRLDEFRKQNADQLSLWDFKHLEFLEFGFVNRSALIKKWYSATGEFGSSTVSARTLAGTEAQITSLLGEELLPGYPLFILAIVQQLEAATKHELAGKSQGFLYDALVLANLAESATNESDIDTNKNYLAHFAFKLFTDSMSAISDTDFQSWHRDYCTRYQLNLDFSGHVDALVKGGLLIRAPDGVSFRYPYLFYYFVAQYISSHLGDEQVLGHIRTLSTYLHHADAANIILFTCHFSRDPVILNAVCETADALFSRIDECQLEDDVKSIEFPTSEQQHRDLGDDAPESNRQKLLQSADERSRKEAKEPLLLDSTTPLEQTCDLEQLNEQLQLNAALKTIQILGQILRNHVGSLEGDVKERLVQTSTNLGLRAMNCVLTVFRENLEETVEILVQAVERRRGAVPRAKIIEDVNRSLWNIAEMGVVAITKYISESVGSERLARTFEEAFNRQTSAAIATVDLSIRLDHYKGFPEKQTLDLLKRFKDNPFGFAVIRDLIWMRFYLYDTDYKVRQRMCSKLSIAGKGEKRLIDNRQKRGKRQRRLK